MAVPDVEEADGNLGRRKRTRPRPALLSGDAIEDELYGTDYSKFDGRCFS